METEEKQAELQTFNTEKREMKEWMSQNIWKGNRYE